LWKKSEEKIITLKFFLNRRKNYQEEKSKGKFKKKIFIKKLQNKLEEN
jgi:hypothetical protein